MMLAEVYEELGNLPQALTLVNYSKLTLFLGCRMVHCVVYKLTNQNAVNSYQMIHSQTSQRGEASRAGQKETGGQNCEGCQGWQGY